LNRFGFFTRHCGWEEKKNFFFLFLEFFFFFSY
jgi:hypothetical protein